ncbi:hypothetical protein ACFLQX_00875 [Bacteroidota bacterium]
MQFRRFTLIVCMLSIYMTSSAQITSFVGGRVYPTFGKTRVYDGSFALGYGAGFTYVFWEYDAWFIKAGVDFVSRSSNIVDIPRYFEVPLSEELVTVDIHYTQQDIDLPVALYYRLYEQRDNAFIVMGGMDIIYTLRTLYQHDTYGKSIVIGDDNKQRINIGFSLGAGYQREISNIFFINILPTINLDIRSEKPFTYFGLTVEMIYGIY